MTGAVQLNLWGWPRSDRLYVTSISPDTVHVVQADSLTLLATIAFPTGSMPWGVAVSSDQSKVYVGSPHMNSIAVISTKHNYILRKIPVGSGQLGMVTVPLRDELLVCLCDGTLARLATTTDSFIGSRLSLPSAGGVIVATVDGVKAFIASAENVQKSWITVVDLEKFTVIKTAIIQTEDGNLQELALDPAGRRLYATDPGGHRLAVLEAETLEDVTSHYALPPFVYPRSLSVSMDETHLFVGERSGEYADTVAVVRVFDGAIERRVEGAGNPRSSVITANGNTLFVVGHDLESGVLAIDTQDYSVRGLSLEGHNVRLAVAAVEVAPFATVSPWLFALWYRLRTLLRVLLQRLGG